MHGSQVVPTLSGFSSSELTAILALIGLVITVVLLMLNVKGAIFIGIILTSLIGIPMGLTNMGDTINFKEACAALPSTFGVIFTKEGLVSLFNDISKLPVVLVTIFSFSLSDTFDTIGTFIGTGRRTGIFSEEDEKSMETTAGFKSKMDKALFADATATSIGAIIGTSNTTTYVESAAGIGAGGRTGLTSVVVAICFAISAFFASFVSAIPSAATALCYSISNGIATGFIFYCIVKICKKKANEIHPILWVVSGLFILNFILLAFTL